MLKTLHSALTALVWQRWRGWNLAPLKERVASGESESSFFSATVERTDVAGRCVLNWSILTGCPCSVGIGISTLWLFLSEARCRALRGERLDGRGAGRQRECCDKFVTHVTELLQKKAFVKCLKPCGAMRPESCEAFGVPRFRRPSGSYPYGSESSGVPAGCKGGLAARVGQAGGRPSKDLRAAARSDHLAEKTALLE